MLERTTDRRAALRGADFVVNTALVAGHPVLAGVSRLDGQCPARKAVGRCHGFMGVYHLADQPGLGRDGLRFEISVVNHFVWLTAVLALPSREAMRAHYA